MHRTFQEFLAGKQAAEEHLTDLLVRNAHLATWRETVVMGTEHMTPRLRGNCSLACWTARIASNATVGAFD